ncbi:bifunctional UDP-N-acetylglucosamine diphosphorylase/glucosamine-1-phosphate N-acetyltransferase GlmU [Maritalea mediterranea]|uniref:Bifunctional protein GlmU n=1 Tax=Maritalea mediterranea TaxID=2909667 RepID=A0ABS9E627_9HYPH|nr:bifunctional UDP-N-acetylglucosamine diphosphorylase/glucosamine-1-phosphate N-acetyltransferase GlmU [Maritalea mediterranea]MCF4098321.1 bifunctional UDP-N-acetylglucosamine diphosphorylase/glucosamine-1-phosphate N-acetyltransferase GlmU [Maritalea mediterranea]
MTDILTIILGAGEGTRMKSDHPKVLHKVGGRPMLGHVLAACAEAGANQRHVVLGPNHDELRDYAKSVDSQITSSVQADRLGTGHAVQQARATWSDFDGYVLVLFADNPLISPDVIKDTVESLDHGADLAVVGFQTENPFGYGRILVEHGQVKAIREEKDASSAERKIKFCNSGIMGFKANCLRAVIDEIKNDNVKGEYYLTDAVELANAQGMKVHSVECPFVNVLGVNDRAQLAEAERIFQGERRAHFMKEGVTLVAPETVFFSFDTKIENDVVIEPNVVFGPGVTVEKGSHIQAFSHLEGAHVGPEGQIGPYARLRPGSKLAAKVKVGNFVETKKADIGEGSKVNHLSYIGDSKIGTGTNIGAGTITCNYDGKNKAVTEIGNNAFIGSNSALVAPVSIADGAYVASGSVITKNVEKNALAIGRARQENKENYAERIRARWEKSE